MLSEYINIDSRSEPANPLAIVVEIPGTVRPKAALITRALDFWMLGGVSFAAWILSIAAHYGFNWNEGLDRQILNLPYTFSVLSVVCNYPHFIASYRIAYGNGIRKITQHWFSMLLVPVLLLSLFIAAYETHSVSLNYPNFQTEDLGSEFLRLGIWLMWVTVGWHYAKQVYGVMLKYAGFDGLKLNGFQKLTLRYALLSVVPINFITMIHGLELHGEDHFQDLTINAFHVPDRWVSGLMIFSVLISLVFLGTLVQGCVKAKKIPSINFVTPFIAFYLWWFPGLWPLPYALMMVPFFHSLQYLPFAYKRIESDGAKKSRFSFTTLITVNIILFLVIGLVLFDAVPSYLDVKLSTRFEFGSSFFTIAMLLFFNVHHFFVDASIWRSTKPPLTGVSVKPS